MTLKEKILALPHVETISDERGMGDGIWVYYREGFKSTMDRLGALHQEHEDTWAEVYALAKRPLPCACEDCEAIKADKAARANYRAPEFQSEGEPGDGPADATLGAL